MLGRLLNTAASTLNPTAYTSRNANNHLESVTEEEHTSGLLFPDASLLRRSHSHAYPLQTGFNSPNASTVGAYDDRGGLELDFLKDFRVLIAQNALGDRDACVLLDTRASSESTNLGLGIDPQAFDNSARHARTVSNVSSARGARRGYFPSPHSSITDSSPFSLAVDARKSSPIGAGAFSRARGRSSTLSPAGGYHDTHNSRAGDSNDSGLLNCIFGSSAFSYRGSSTKMHIISADEETERTTSVSPARRETDSTGSSRSGAARSPLSRAHTTGSSSDFTPNRGVDGKPSSKVTVLLTRMFSVNLPENGETGDRQDYAASIYHESLPETGFPFPDVAKQRKKIKEKKTPMYAVAITIQIPLLARNPGRPGSRFSSQGPDSPGFGMSCSLDSDNRWRGGYLEDSLSLASAPASLDERIDLLVDHWDVITRTLSHLERLARKEILFLLKKVDSLSGAHPKPSKPPNMQRTNQALIQLPANILAVNSKLKEEALRSSRRIGLALQTPHVVTGQSRWGVWREEGRSIARTLGDKEHSFFFLVLMTAFLGNHTEWLNALGPDWHRRRHYLQQKAQQDADPTVSNRTVIISPDKMTARRLIFLLAAFLPAKQRFEPLPSPLRPGTSTSVRAISQSPPTVPVLRQESLRRAIERRARAQRLNVDDRETHQRSVSASSTETAHKSSDDVEPTMPAEAIAQRRGSDARSIKTLSIPINPKDTRTKKVSTATTSTITQSETVPVPHFTSRQTISDRELVELAVAGRVESLASENLMRNLKRSESSATSTNSSVPSGGGRWGSLFSGLWSSRQESSTDDSEATPPADVRRRSVSVFASPTKQRPPTLSQMVKEVTGPIPEHPLETTTTGNIEIPHAPSSQHALAEDSPQSLSLTDQVKESQLKLSVRAEDGVVDVDLPLPGFVSLSSSGDSTVASPKKTRTSVTSVDVLGSTHSSNSGFHWPSRDSDGPNVNVAGWLKSFHEDFLLQAVRPYNSLEADIKRAMQAEPFPSIPSNYGSDGPERWVDVATTLIADTRTFTVKRLRLRRKVPVGGWRSPSSPPVPSRPATPRHGTSSSTSQFTNFFSNATGSSKNPIPTTDGFDGGDVEERFIEEPVMDLDGILVDAVERVLAPSGQSSLAHSKASSPSRNRRGRDDRSSSEPTARDDGPPSLEVPRGQCRRMVLGALEEVVRSVTAEHCREDVDGELALADRERKRSLAGADNTLREGVRKWLLDVEDAW